MDVLFLKAIAVVVALLSGGLLVLWLAKKSPATRAAILVWLLGLSPLVIALFTGRVRAFTNPPIYDETFLSRTGLKNPISYAVTILTVCVALVTAVRSRPKGGLAWKGFLAFWFLIALAGLFAKVPGISRSFLLILPIMYALRRHIEIRHFRNVFRLYTVGSLVAVLLTPGWALQEYSASLILVPYRLFGLTETPQSIAAIAGLSLLFEFHSGKRLYGLAAIACLVLSQGKTAWAAAVVALLIHFVFRGRGVLRPVRLLAVGFVVVCAGLVLGNYFNALDAQQQQSLLSLTGRTSVWDITVETWRDNPVFGYGFSIWQPSFQPRWTLGLGWAGGAHNQYLQTLGQAGIVGVMGLTAYLAALLVASRSRPLALSAVCFLLILLASETFLNADRVSIGLLVHGAVFALAASPRPVSVSDPPAGAVRYAGR